MIAIVVLTLIVCALTVDYLVLRLPQRQTAVQASVGDNPAIHVDRTHMWLLPEASGLARVGIDEVASLLIGRPERIEWAPAGLVTRGAPLAVVIAGGRRLTLRSPVDGAVVEENPALAASPLDIATNPLDKGWLVRLRPANLAAQLAEMRSGTRLRDWSRQEMARLRDFILARSHASNLVGATAMDGGELDLGAAGRLDEAAFADAVRMVFADEPSGAIATTKATSQKAVTP